MCDFREWHCKDAGESFPIAPLRLGVVALFFPAKWVLAAADLSRLNSREGGFVGGQSRPGAALCRHTATIKKRNAERILKEIRNLITQQIKFYHDLMSHTKTTFFHNVGGEIYKNRFNYRTEGLNQILDY
jgi:hypothetical protein